jgi:hypothetical protein
VLTGKRFRLERATLAIDAGGPARRAVTIPSGSIIKVISTPQDTQGIIEVSWENRILQMFAVDVNLRGTEIPADG